MSASKFLAVFIQFFFLHYLAKEFQVVVSFPFLPSIPFSSSIQEIFVADFSERFCFPRFCSHE